MIIVNADDYGLNEHITKAIAESFAKGLITDTTMTANGEYFGEAVALSKEQGFFDRIGIHFNLTEGVPLTEDILLEPRFVTDGRFNKKYRYSDALTETEQAAVYKELTAQADRIQAAGIVITHADSHHHIHTAPSVAPIAERVCREHNVRKIRIRRNLCGVTPEAMDKAERFNRRLREQGFLTTAYFAYIRDIGGIAVPDDTELLVHPDFDKDRILIDRTGTVGGVPCGDAFILPQTIKNHTLKGYTQL